MCDLYIQTNDSVAGYWFAGDLDALVNDALDVRDSPLIFMTQNYWTCVISLTWIRNYTSRVSFMDIHFVPKVQPFECGKVVLGLEIGKLGEEDEKYCIRNCNQYVTHMWSICDLSETLQITLIHATIHLWPNWDSYIKMCDPYVTTYDPSITQPMNHMWFLCNASVTHMWRI